MTHQSIDNCLGRTCLKWGKDGELAEQDLRLVLERLCEVDVPVCASLEADPGLGGLPRGATVTAPVGVG